jgi:hypothetical protein
VPGAWPAPCRHSSPHLSNGFPLASPLRAHRHSSRRGGASGRFRWLGLAGIPSGGQRDCRQSDHAARNPREGDGPHGQRSARRSGAAHCARLLVRRRCGGQRYRVLVRLSPSTGHRWLPNLWALLRRPVGLTTVAPRRLPLPPRPKARCPVRHQVPTLRRTRLGPLPRRRLEPRLPHRPVCAAVSSRARNADQSSPGGGCRR